jgi:hypothetical protein
VCSRKVLGDEFDGFVAELREALGAAGDARYPETLTWGYTVARKPA